MLANVAELGAERMEETIGKASLRDAAIGTGGIGGTNFYPTIGSAVDAYLEEHAVHWKP
jgi:hypothetical protein